MYKIFLIFFIVLISGFGISINITKAYDMGYFEIIKLDPIIYLDFETVYYSYNSSLLKTYDISGNYLNGILNGSPKVAVVRDENENGSANFFGSRNYISVPYDDSFDIDIDGSFTISMRLNALNDGTYSELVHAPINSKYSYRVYLTMDKKLKFVMYDGRNEFNKVLDFSKYYDKWARITIAKDNNKVCMAINSNEYSCSNFSGLGSTKAGTGELLIGLHPSLVNDFNGKMDDLAIFNGFIGQADIEKLYGMDNSCGNGVCNANENAKTCGQDCSASEWEEAFLDSFYDKYSNNMGASHDFSGYIYNSNNYIRSFLDMYRVTEKAWYLEQAIKISEKFITKQSIEISSTDPILDSLHPLLRKRGGSDELLELPADLYPSLHPYWAARLEVSRLYRELTALAIIIKEENDLRAQYGSVANRIVELAVQDVLNNPLYINIGETTNFTYTPLHHLVSHHAIILKNMYKLTGTTEYQTKAINLLEQMINTSFPGGSDGSDLRALAWGGLQCVDLNYSDASCYNMNDAYNGSHCKDTQGHAYCYPMDTAHSRDTVDTFIQFYEDGYMEEMGSGANVFIDRLAYTLENVMTKEIDNQIIVADFIDGTDAPSGTIGDLEWIGISPGWASLGRYDKSLNISLMGMIDNTTSMPAFKPNYCAEMLKNSVAGGSITPASPSGLSVQ